MMVDLTENEMGCIADICKKYFDACKIGKVRPGEQRVMLLTSVLEKFKAAVASMDGELDGNRLQVVQSETDKPPSRRIKVVDA